MNKRGELKTNGVLPKTIPSFQTGGAQKLLKHRIAEMLAEMKLGSGEVIASFQALCQEMLAIHYDKSWGYGQLYPLKDLKDVVAYVQAKYGSEYRLLFEGKIIFLSGGFIKSDFPEGKIMTSYLNFGTISKALLKGVPLTKFILPREEPEIVTLYIIPLISKKDLNPNYLLIGEEGWGKYIGGSLSRRLALIPSLVNSLASDLLRRKMVHSVPSIPKPKSTPVTGVNQKIPFLKRA